MEVRFLPSRLIWVWLNLAELRFRAPAIGGSNPPTQTISAVQIHLGVAQSGQSAGSGNRRLGVRIPPSRLSERSKRGTSKLVNAPVPQSGLAGFDPLVPYKKKEIAIGAGRYGDLSSLIRSSFRVRLPAAPFPEDHAGLVLWESTGSTSRIR